MAEPIARINQTSSSINVPADYFFWFLLGLISNVFLVSFLSLRFGLLLFLSFSALLLSLAGRWFLAFSFFAGFLFSLLRVVFVPALHLSLIPTGLETFLLELQQRLALALTRLFPEPIAGFSQGIIIGKQGISFEPEFWEALKLTGTAHLVAVSGYNLTVVAKFITRFLSWLTVHRKLIWLFALAGIFLFILFVGAPVSAVRAGLMAALVIIAERFAREQNLKIAFTFVLGLMLLVNPSLLREDLSFQLSFLAAFGIFYLAPVWLSQEQQEKTSGGWVELKKIVAETLSAQAMVLPLLVYRFGQLSLIGLLANLLVLPLIPLAMSLSFLSGLGFLLWSGLGQGIAFFSYPLLNLIVAIIKLFARLPFAGLSGVFLGPLAMILYYGLILLFIKIKNSHRYAG